jgi:hypothetical protein
MRRAAQARGVRRFASSQEHLDTIREICREAFGGDPAPYRIDSLGPTGQNWTLPFRLQPDENVVLIHANSLHAASLAMSHGGVITHWVCEGCETTDARGKLWLDYPGVRPYLGPDLWISAGEAIVY